MVTRRGFLNGILAAGVAPYVVTTAGVLMPVRKLWVPDDYIMVGDEIGHVIEWGPKGFTIRWLSRWELFSEGWDVEVGGEGYA